METQLIPLELIDVNPWQTRQKEDTAHVEEIAHSIKAMGMMQTPSARRIGERYQLAFGHTRKAAYVLLNSLGVSDEYANMPLAIRDISDEQMAVAAFEENDKRKNLNPVERAQAVQKMLSDFDWTQEQVAEKLHIDRSGVSNMLRMLRLPEDVLETISDGILPVRSAMGLLPIFELSVDDRNRLGEHFGDSYYEFVSVAKNGEINSDSIRARVEFYLTFLHPQQLELEEVVSITTDEEPMIIPGIDDLTTDDQTESESGGSLPVATQAGIDWGHPQEGEASHEQTEQDEDHTGEVLQGAVPGDQQDEVPDGNSGVETDEPESPAIVTAENHTTPPPAAETPQADPNETILTIIWKASGVIVSVKKPGAPPSFKFLEELSVDLMPALIHEMGIE